MRPRKFCFSLFLSAALAVGCFAQGASTAKAEDRHLMATPAQVKWGPAPPSLPPGAEMAVLYGDPSQAGALYAIRIKAPDGFKVPPHWHPVDENVIVIKGVLMMGLGEKFDATVLHELPAGSFIRMPKEERHFARAKGETILHLYGMGPFVINYVSPEDDPRNKTGSR